MKRLMRWWRPAWGALRAITGDDAYERYLAHHVRQHDDTAALSRRQFEALELERRWSRVSRCC